MIPERKTLRDWQPEPGLDVRVCGIRPQPSTVPAQCDRSTTTTTRGTIRVVSSRPNTRRLQPELHSTTCCESGAVHTVSRVTRRQVGPRCRLTPRHLGSAGQFSPLPWRRLRFPASNNASLSSQSCRERSRLSAEAAPVADPDWPLEILSGKRAKTPRGHLLDAINLGMKMSARCGGQKRAQQRGCPCGAASDLPTCLARRIFHAALE